MTPKKPTQSKQVTVKQATWKSKIPPSLGHNIRKDIKGLPKFDEEKFCIYSVFRESILYKVMREQISEVLED